MSRSDGFLLYHSWLKFSPVYFDSCLGPDFVNTPLFLPFLPLHCLHYTFTFFHPQSFHLIGGFTPSPLDTSFSFCLPLIRTGSSQGHLFNPIPGMFLCCSSGGICYPMFWFIFLFSWSNFLSNVPRD